MEPIAQKKRYLYVLKENDSVSLFESADDHNHAIQGLLVQLGIPQATKAEITKLYDFGVDKGERIIEALILSGINPPTKTQLNNFLAQFRKTKYGKNQISLGE